MNEQCGTDRVTDDGFEDKEIMEILNGMDDDLINMRIDELLAEKGECADIDSIKKKAFGKLEQRKRRRGILKRAVAVAVAAVATVSTVYAKSIRKALESFIGKSAVYQTVVDGDAYYLPAELPLGDRYILKYADMSEGTLSLCIKTSSAEVSDEWYENLDICVSEPNGEEKYIGGGYSIENGDLYIYFYKLPMFGEFEISLSGEVYLIQLEKAENLEVDENLVIGVPQTSDPGVSPLIANVAAIRTDEGTGAGIKLAVGFEDRDLKLGGFYGSGWDDNKAEFHRMFVNETEDSIISSSNRPFSNSLSAIGEDGTVYELKEPPNAVGRPIMVFETGATPGMPLTLEISAVEAHYEKTVDSITLDIPDEGEVMIDREIDFIIQKAVVKSIKRTSETTADVLFELNTGEDKTVKIKDLSAYSKDVKRGDTKINDNVAVLTLTFDAGTKEVKIEFSWPYFVIVGNWKIIL